MEELKKEETTVTFGAEQLGNSTFYATEPMQLKNDLTDAKPVPSKKTARHGPGKVEYWSDSKGNIFKRKIGDYEYEKRCEEQAG